MKLSATKILKPLKIGLFVILLFGSIGFASKKFDQKTCISIEVNIKNQFENYFINENDVIEIVTNRGEKSILGQPLADINLKAIETELYHNKFIRNAEVFKDHSGRLLINIDQSRPIARLMSDKMSDRYISNMGEVLPLSRRYTARVMLIDGPFADNAKMYDLNKTEKGRQFMDLLQFIESDKFWKAQIAQMNIDSKGNITMYTQVSKQAIEFGQPIEIKEKFRNLSIFYKEILPSKGWNTYNKVNVKYKNQIVCE